MDKRPNIKKRIALELFRSIKKNRANYMNCVHSFGSVRFVVMYPAVIAGAIAMSRPLSRICLSRTS